MSRELQRILLTGPPGCGKTTAVVKIVGALAGRLRMAGFYTEEMREAGQRTGFRWRRLDGRTGVLAPVDSKSPYRVSKYGVDVETFDKDVVSVLDPRAAGVRAALRKRSAPFQEFLASFFLPNPYHGRPTGDRIESRDGYSPHGRQKGWLTTGLM